MQSRFSEEDCENILLTLENISNTLTKLTQWNENVSCVEDYTGSQFGMQLLAANCTLLTAIGEGINRCNRIIPGFLSENFPEIPWRAVVGMRNHIAHGYFELDAEVIYETVKNDVFSLNNAINRAIGLLKS